MINTQHRLKRFRGRLVGAAALASQELAGSFKLGKGRSNECTPHKLLYRTHERVVKKPGMTAMAIERRRQNIHQLSIGQRQWARWCCYKPHSDTIFCMNGTVCIKTREPGSEIVLEPGESAAIPSGRIHYIMGVDEKPCQCMIVHD